MESRIVAFDWRPTEHFNGQQWASECTGPFRIACSR